MTVTEGIRLGRVGASRQRFGGGVKIYGGVRVSVNGYDRLTGRRSNGRWGDNGLLGGIGTIEDSISRCWDVLNLFRYRLEVRCISATPPEKENDRKT